MYIVSLRSYLGQCFTFFGKPAGEAAWCHYNNDTANGAKYGKLYNWYAVSDSRGLAPVGYHIPSDAEWTILTDYLGVEKNAGAKMKSKQGWAKDGNGTNSSGFSGLPGGKRLEGGPFASIGKDGWWWSSTGFSSPYYFAWSLSLSYANGAVFAGFHAEGTGFSVRCLRD